MTILTRLPPPARCPRGGGPARQNYQDTIELKSNDHRVLIARVQKDDGSWEEVMTVEYRRTR